MTCRRSTPHVNRTRAILSGGSIWYSLPMKGNAILTSGFARALGLLTEGVCVADSKGTVLFTNGAFSKTLGYHRDELAGRPVSLFLDADQDPTYPAAAARKSNGTWSGDLLLKRKDETVIAAEVNVVLLQTNSGDEQGMVLLVRDVEGDPRLDAALSNISCVDPLTGLPDRAYFEMALENEWRRASRARSHLSMLLVGMDGFEEYLAARGRHTADAAVRQVARSLHESAQRAGELTARWDTSVFAILLPGLGAPDARLMAQKLRRQVKALSMPRSDEPGDGTITVSVGLAAALPDRNLPSSSLVDATMAALHTAMESGGNRVASGRRT